MEPEDLISGTKIGIKSPFCINTASKETQINCKSDPWQIKEHVNLRNSFCMTKQHSDTVV